MYNWPNGVYSPLAFAPEGVLRSSKGPGGSHGGISEAFGPGSGGFLKGSGDFREKGELRRTAWARMVFFLLWRHAGVTVTSRWRHGGVTVASRWRLGFYRVSSTRIQKDFQSNYKILSMSFLCIGNLIKTQTPP